MRIPAKLVLVSVMIAVAMISTQGEPVQAAAITVTTTDDELNSDGDCSLREAI